MTAIGRDEHRRHVHLRAGIEHQHRWQDVTTLDDEWTRRLACTLPDCGAELFEMDPR